MDLLKFLLLIVKYKIYPKNYKLDVVRQIRDILQDSGSVWIKFAQTLSQLDMIIDNEFSETLEPLFNNCKIHDHEYSKNIIKQELGDNYCLESMKLIGSGSIAQTYKVLALCEKDTNSQEKKFLCIKILHPNVKQEIDEAVHKYNSIKDSFFFPKKLKNICFLFFESLKNQWNTEIEFNNQLAMYKLFQDYNIYRKKTIDISKMTCGKYLPLVKVAKPISYSDNTLVMEYIPSVSINRSNIDRICENIDQRALLLLLQTTYMFIFFTCIAKKLIHLDLHPGNLGYIIPETKSGGGDGNDDTEMYIVIYDMGQFIDMRNSDIELETFASRYLTGNVLDIFIDFSKEEYHEILYEKVPPGRLLDKDFVNSIEMGVTSVLDNTIEVSDEKYLWIIYASLKINTITYLGIKLKKKLNLPECSSTIEFYKNNFYKHFNLDIKDLIILENACPGK